MDCFTRKVPGSRCFASLIADVTRRGTCDSGDNPASAFNETVNFWGWYDLGNACELAEIEDDYNYGDDSSYDYGDYSTPKTIVKGTCSAHTAPLFRGQLGTLGGNSPWGGISSPPSNFDRRVGEISPPLQNSTGGWGRFLPPLVGILPTHPSKY